MLALDDQRVVVGGSTGVLKIVDVATGKVERDIACPRGDCRGFLRIHDGNILAWFRAVASGLGVYNFLAGDSAITTLSPLHIAGVSAAVECGRALVVATGNGDMRVFQRQNPGVVEVRAWVCLRCPATFVLLTQQSSLLPKPFLQYTMSSRMALSTRAQCMIAASESSFVVGGYGSEATLEMYDLVSKQTRWHAQDGRAGSTVRALSMLVPGYFAACNEDGFIRLYSVDDGECLRKIGNTGPGRAFIAGQSNWFIVANSDAEVRVYRDDVCTQTLSGAFRHESSALEVCGKRLVAASAFSALKVWEPLLAYDA